MKDIGLMHYFLGLEVRQRQGEIFLAQGKYTVDVLKKFGMMDCKSMSTPMITNLRTLHDSDTGSDLVDPTMYTQQIGSLMYMIQTRSDICYAMIAMSPFMTEPGQRHSVAAKHILRYLRGTITYGLRYTSSGGQRPMDQKSTSGYCFSLGYAMIFWSSRKQGSISQSKAEVEYIATSDASKQAVWLKKLVSGLFGENLEMTVVHCDNQICIKLTSDREPDISRQVKTY
jgi:hypothetical protein